MPVHRVRLFGCALVSLVLMTPAVGLAEAGKGADASQPQKLTVTKRLIDKPGEIVAKLDNGLTVIAKEHRTAPIASVRMYVKTGSLYEADHLGAGLSHLFEHLLHGGTTETRTEAESRRILQELGNNSNAATSYWYTTYYITTGREGLGRATNLLADWITNPAFPDKEFDREWGVVQRELEGHLGDPARQLWYLVMETMYEGHPAQYPVIGYKPIVQSLTKEEIVAYWRERYVPDNVVVAVAGDVDAEKMLDIVRTEFAHFIRRAVPEVVLPEPPTLVTPRTVVKHMATSGNTALVELCWPSIELTHPDLYALDVLSYILTEGRSSRLFRAIVREKQLAFGINSFSWTPHWGRGVFAIMFATAPGKFEACKKAILQEIKKARTELVSDSELAKAKQQKTAEHIFGQQTAEDVAGTMVSDFIATGDPHFSDAYVAGIRKVTAEEVRAAARKYLDPELFATVAVLPEQKKEEGATTKTALQDPIKKVSLDNGLRVLLRRDSAVPIVTMQAFFASGLLSEDEQNNGISNLVAELATRGTKSRSAEEIGEFFDSRGGSIAGRSGNNTIYLSAQVLKDDWKDALDVFADVVIRPTFPKAELERLRPRVLNAIDRLDEEWQSELQVFFRKRFFPKHPYGLVQIGRADAVKAITTEDLGKHHATWFKGGNGVLAVFGDIDVDAVEQRIREVFADLPAGEAPPLPTDPRPPITGDTLYVKESKHPERAGLMLGFRGIRYTNVDDRYALDTLDCIMSGAGLPSGWLHHELREGSNDYVYAVHAYNFVGLAPGFFGIYAGCEPQRVSKVYQIIREQCAKAVAGKITREEFERAKGIMITTEHLRTRTVAQMATRAALDELYGLGYDAYDKYDERVKAVTMEDVKRVAKAFLDNAIITVTTPKPDLVRIGIEPSEAQ